MNDLQVYQRDIYAWAKSKGWWDSERNIGELLALIHSEVSEALEDYRSGNMETRFFDGKPCGFGSELADVVIRVLDLAEHLGIDIGKEIDIKMAYNETRPFRHGNKIA